MHRLEQMQPMETGDVSDQPLLALPLELRCVILAHLDLSSLFAASYACKTLRNTLLHPYVWRNRRSEIEAAADETKATAGKARNLTHMHTAPRTT